MFKPLDAAILLTIDYSDSSTKRKSKDFSKSMLLRDKLRIVNMPNLPSSKAHARR